MKIKLKLVDYIIYTTLIVFAVTVLFPFYSVILMSFSTEEGYFSSIYHLTPNSFTIDWYISVLQNTVILRALFISFTVVVLGVSLSLLLTMMGGYALTKTNLRGRTAFFRIIIFTMFFGGGLIAFYILMRGLHLTGTIFVLFLPSAISTFNIILVKNYITNSVPPSLEESARIDGYNDLVILFKIIVPVCKPIIATITLFYAVSYWNDWFNAMLFLSDNKLYPLSLVLRNMIVGTESPFAQSALNTVKIPEITKAVVIVLNIIPIAIVYPFLQKYFVQGIMLGSIKE